MRVVVVYAEPPVILVSKKCCLIYTFNHPLLIMLHNQILFLCRRFDSYRFVSLSKPNIRTKRCWMTRSSTIFQNPSASGCAVSKAKIKGKRQRGNQVGAKGKRQKAATSNLVLFTTFDQFVPIKKVISRQWYTGVHLSSSFPCRLFHFPTETLPPRRRQKIK